jgi:hypothetical protein
LWRSFEHGGFYRQATGFKGSRVQGFKRFKGFTGFRFTGFRFIGFKFIGLTFMGFAVRL